MSQPVAIEIGRDSVRNGCRKGEGWGRLSLELRVGAVIGAEGIAGPCANGHGPDDDAAARESAPLRGLVTGFERDGRGREEKPFRSRSPWPGRARERGLSRSCRLRGVAGKGFP